jgi:tetratricopeptide (TPR) repeat protein
MKSLVLPLLLLAACSSTPEKTGTRPAQVVKNEAFKKPRALSNNDVPEYYQETIKGMSPALQDETLDRYTTDELSNIKTNDPLVNISVKCLQKDYDGAFDAASKVFDQYKRVAAYWNLVANCHLNKGSHRKALLFYNKALEVSPNYVPSLNNIGVMYSRQGLDQKALVAFERANKQSKFSKTPRYNLARLYLSYGLAESALPIFEGLSNENPHDVDLLNATASAYFLMSDYQRALSHFERIPKGEWSRAEIGLNLAVTLKKVGRVKEANDVFSSVDEPKTSHLKRYYAVIKNQLGGAE